MKTKVINIIGGPGVGKTVIGSMVFAKIKLRQRTAEFASEYAKELVWKGEFDLLNDQYMVSTEQYRKLRSMDGKVEYIITDGPLVHGLYYNTFYESNVSDKEKTERKILQYMDEFHNINILLTRGDYPYETAGRVQKTIEEAIDVDKKIVMLLNKYAVSYKTFLADEKNVDAIVEYCLSC